jgi:hypothetical protein
MRQRRNFNFHPADDYPSNRLLNAIEPDSCVPPHRLHGVIHSLVALEPGTVAFEAKAGPFVERTPAELLPFAPPEGSPQAADYRDRMRSRFGRILRASM